MSDVLLENLGDCPECSEPISTVYSADRYVGGGGAVDPTKICDNDECPFYITNGVRREEPVGFKGNLETDLFNLDANAELDVDHLVGQIPDENLAALDATKIIGQLTDAQLAAIAAPKVTGELVGSQIAASEIVAEHLSVSELSAITGELGTIIGGLYTTRGVSQTGPGFEMELAGLRAYDANEDQTYNLRATTGKVVVGAGPSVADGGAANDQRVEIDRAGMRLYGEDAAAFDLAWATVGVADPPGDGSLIDRGQMTTPIKAGDSSLEGTSRYWIDARGAHSQITIPGVNGGVPFRTFDLDPSDLSGLRLHGVDLTTGSWLADMIRIDPQSGVTFKTVQGGALGPRAKWNRPDGSIGGQVYTDDFAGDGEQNNSAQVVLESRRKATFSGVGSARRAATQLAAVDEASARRAVLNVLTDGDNASTLARLSLTRGDSSNLVKKLLDGLGESRCELGFWQMPGRE